VTGQEPSQAPWTARPRPWSRPGQRRYRLEGQSAGPDTSSCGRRYGGVSWTQPPHDSDCDGGW